jgi:Lon-like ATP-dependent protease
MSDSDDEDDINEHEQPDSLTGGKEFDTTEEIDVPDKLINQVIGQESAVETIKAAAEQKRHVLMIGEPGTGKSMLSKAMAELMGSEDLRDVLAYRNPDDDNNPRIRTVPAGKGEHIVDAFKEKSASRERTRNLLMWGLIAFAIIYGFISNSILLGLVAAAAVVVVFKYVLNDVQEQGPELLIDNSDKMKAPFNDATGAHDGSLLGDVRHDPFQSGGMETPAHKRIEPGAIHKSSGGVLFIDEINTLDIRQQQKLMTAIQDGEFQITGQSERSSGAMVQTEPVPTDFIFVAAGNMDAIENMHPALRDRIKGYGYEQRFDDKINDTKEIRQKLVQFVAQEVNRDENIPHFTREAVESIILEAQRRAGEKGKITLRLRDLGGLVRVAGDMAKLNDDSDLVEKKHVLSAKEKSKSIEQQYVDERIERKKKYGEIETEPTVGKVNGLAVQGKDSGTVLQVVGKVSPSQGSGEVIATGKLQQIAEESVDNVSAVIKEIGSNLGEKDVHIQFLQTYEGVNGDSASVTIATAIISDLEDIPVKQNVAMTGSLTVQGEVIPVGGVTHKIEAAANMGMDKVIIPKANSQDVMIEDEYKEQIEIIEATHLTDVLDVALKEDIPAKEGILDKLRNIRNQTELETNIRQKSSS